jgi:hypothetical protein
VNRRQLLYALGLSAAGLSLPSVRAANAGAGRAGTAKRILFYVTSHGTCYDRYKLRPGRRTDTEDFEADLPSLAASEWSPILAPLSAHARKLLVVDGLGNGCGIVPQFNEHEEGHASILTGRIGTPIYGSIARPDGPSLDQVLGASRDTPFRTLEWAVGGWSVTFDELGQPLPYEGDPVAAFDRVLGGVATPTTPTGEIVARHQAKVLEVARARYDALVPKLSAQDRVKLEQHRDLLDELAGRLEVLASLECEPPPRPSLALPWGDAGYPQERTEAFQDLALATFACGLTDVITLRMDTLFNETVGAPPGDLHNDFAHNTETNPDAYEVMATYHTWHAQRLARLLDRLDAVPEGDGTMLDHTLVVWCNELATGHHTFDDLPVVVAGGTTALRSGRVVRYAARTVLGEGWAETSIGRPHQQLLTTLGRAMGEPMDHFGLRELPTTDGGTLDCTGVLPGFLR